MAGKYPRISERKPLGRKCVTCSEPSTHQIIIQTTFTRGDDEVVYACPDHSDLTAVEYLEAHVERQRFKQWMTSLRKVAEAEFEYSHGAVSNFRPDEWRSWYEMGLKPRDALEANLV